MGQTCHFDDSAPLPNSHSCSSNHSLGNPPEVSDEDT